MSEPYKSNNASKNEKKQENGMLKKIQKSLKLVNWKKIALLAGLASIFTYFMLQHFVLDHEIIKENGYSQMIQDADAGKVKSIQMNSGFLVEEARVELKDGTKYRVASPRMDAQVAANFVKGGISDVRFNYPDPDYSRTFSLLLTLLITGSLIMTVLPTLSGFSLGKSKVKSTTKFSDVAGAEEAKRALEDVVSYLENPDKFEKLGARFTKGVIMYGEPGTGKTLLARAVAGEAGANFIAVSGSDFGSMFVGMSAMKVRKVFARARKTAPCVLFIDEIDAIGGKRLSEGSSVAREMGSTLNQMLVEMDGFDNVPGVIIIAATNRLELLDPALLRSGRFDRRINMPSPSLTEREAILRIHAAKIAIDENFSFPDLARATIGMSGADLSNVINQAAIHAAKMGALTVQTKDAMKARDIVLMGEARPSMSQGFDLHTRHLLAAHEAGHAVLGMIKGPDPVTRVSIIPRGPSLGATFMSPVKERFVHDNTYITAQIKVLLGGRAAENLVFNVSTTGAQDDLNRATKLAQAMVFNHGMSELGLQVVSDESSPELRYAAEKLVGELLQKCMSETQQTLVDHGALFQDMIQALLEFEEIDEVSIVELQKKHNLLHIINRDEGLSGHELSKVAGSTKMFPELPVPAAA